MGLFSNIFKKDKPKPKVKEEKNMNQLDGLLNEAQQIKAEVNPTPSQEVVEDKPKKKVGRPKGSKNKPKTEELPKATPVKAQNLVTIVGNQIIEYNVEDSKIHGKGMFAKSHIPKNSMLSEAYQLDEFGKPKDQIFPFGFFTNHSSKNSNAFLATFVDKLYIVTSRDIAKGEEILFDYNEYPHLENANDDWE